MRSSYKPTQFHLPTNKGWADIALGWPFVLIICLALIGLLFSKIIFNSNGQTTFTVISVIVGTYLFIAVQVRIKKGKVNTYRRPRIVTSIIYIFLFYSFSYFAVAHGVTAIFGFFVTNPHEEIITVQEKSRSVGRGSKVGSLHMKDMIVFPSRALHVNQELLAQVDNEDSVLLKGRSAWFGFYVDEIYSIKR